jgi:hypothetical protein
VRLVGGPIFRHTIVISLQDWPICEVWSHSFDVIIDVIDDLIVCFVVCQCVVVLHGIIDQYVDQFVVTIYDDIVFGSYYCLIVYRSRFQVNHFLPFAIRYSLRNAANADKSTTTAPGWMFIRDRFIALRIRCCLVVRLLAVSMLSSLSLHFRKAAATARSSRSPSLSIRSASRFMA